MTRTNDYKVIAHILAYRSSYEDCLWIDLCPPPEFSFWSLSPQYLRMWPGLEIGLLHISSFKMRSYWDRVNSGCNISLVYLWERRNLDTNTTEGGHMWRWTQRRGDASTSQGTPRSQQSTTRLGRGTDSPSQPSCGSKPTDTLTLDFQPPDLCETIKIPSLSH